MIARSLVLFFVGWVAANSVFVGPVRAQPKVEEGAILLAQIKRVMKRHLEGVPNYTCLETVERYQLRPGAAKESLVDVLRLEVAYVEGKELFTWPGSKSFAQEEFREVVATGAFGSGDFVLHARGVFISDGTRFEYRGKEELAGKAAHKYFYEKPLFRSGYSIANQERGLRAEVAYEGFFWVDAETLDLMRMTVRALDIPVYLQVAAASNQLDYSMVPLGGRSALLPKQSELRLTDTKGIVSINRTRLTRCKLFQGESSISFEEIGEDSTGEVKAQTLVTLPEELELELALETEIVHGEAAVGDAVEARLRRDVKAGKEVLLPKGMLARGRIVELTRHDNPVCLTVTLRFDEIENESKRAPLRLRLLRTEGAGPRFGPVQPGGRGYVELPLPGRNGFLWLKPGLRIGRGFVTIWETQKLVP
jgi:hypothetical protein